MDPVRLEERERLSGYGVGAERYAKASAKALPMLQTEFFAQPRKEGIKSKVC
jgi:hypothetical protein